MAKSFAGAMLTFFGKKPGQTILGFAEEIKKLSAEDRKELADLLTKELGETVELPPDTKDGKAPAAA